MNKLTIDSIDFKGQRALVRVDFNVPLTDDGKVRDDTRLRATIPTIQHILNAGGSVVLMSHLGRPIGEPSPEFSLKPVAEKLSKLLDRQVTFMSDCIGDEVQLAVGKQIPGDVMLLENLRFHTEEKANDPDFAAQLARLGSVYVNDAFGTIHRAHASLHAVAKFFKGKAVAGYLVKRELEYLGSLLSNPKRPFVAVIGGAKISGKIVVIKRLLEIVDTLLIGGGMAYTLIKAQGGSIGKSLCEADVLDIAKRIMTRPDAGKIILPIDSVVALNPEATDTIMVGNGSTQQTKCWRIYPSNSIPDDWIGFDIGDDARKEYADAIRTAKTVFWNGPVGMFEKELFAAGTETVAEALVEMTARGGISVVGGGDTVAALNQFGLAGKISHVSTGGGASLEFLEGEELHGISVLTDRKDS